MRERRRRGGEEKEGKVEERAMKSEEKREGTKRTCG